LRLPREYIVRRMFAELEQGGFDLSESEMAVFMYPGPDGRRPVDLARQNNMSRQAMNYVLAGLARRGYILRPSEDGPGSARGLQVTERGRKLFAQMRHIVTGIEAEWRAHLGADRFNGLRATLQDLSRWLGTLEPTLEPSGDGRREPPTRERSGGAPRQQTKVRSRSKKKRSSG
jgi:DNA-binding MarR family transcriptional regulator